MTLTYNIVLKQLYQFWISVITLS